MNRYVKALILFGGTFLGTACCLLIVSQSDVGYLDIDGIQKTVIMAGSLIAAILTTCTYYLKIQILKIKNT
ncbi:MAG: hypothetical protein ACRDAO_06945 [Culicoidibacterales bacterium]